MTDILTGATIANVSVRPADRPTWERSASGHLYLQPPRLGSPSRRILGWVAYHRYSGGWRWHATTTTGDRVGGRVPPGAGTALARGRALVEAAVGVTS